MPLKTKVSSILITLLIVGALSTLIIYGFGSYGIALFILVPILIGILPTVLAGYTKSITKSQSFILGLITLGLFCLGLLAFGMEGLICIVMTIPLALLLVFLGSRIGLLLLKRIHNQSIVTVIVFTLAIPFFSFAEKDTAPDLLSVTSSVTIDAPIETVWENVLSFPELDEPTELIFKAGIAYPINATIDGEGVGALRHCNFTTGSFVEPITVWEAPNLLKFSVLEQPAPMKEVSFWDVVHAPHLQDYFLSKEGQFKLTALENGQTLLEGTTWYYHNIKPVFYWRIWSENIIHQIHNRVLVHIKQNAERS